MELNPDIELDTARTNVEGFMRMADTAFHHFREHGGGQLAVISSIAGTKGLGVALPILLRNGFRTPTSMHWNRWPECKN